MLLPPPPTCSFPVASLWGCPVVVSARTYTETHCSGSQSDGERKFVRSLTTLDQVRCRCPVWLCCHQSRAFLLWGKHSARALLSLLPAGVPMQCTGRLQKQYFFFRLHRYLTRKALPKYIAYREEVTGVLRLWKVERQFIIREQNDEWSDLQQVWNEGGPAVQHWAGLVRIQVRCPNGSSSFVLLVCVDGAM